MVIALKIQLSILSSDKPTQEDVPNAERQDFVVNFLAHAFLSQNDSLEQLGNLGGDFVKGKKFDGLQPEIIQGVLKHRAIDVFTDTHPVSSEIRQIFRPELGLFSGILVDMTYDHFLAKNWENFSSGALEDFVQQLYNSFVRFELYIPAQMLEVFHKMEQGNWLLKYGSFEGLEEILTMMSYRMGNKKDLTLGIQVLKQHYVQLENLSLTFFKAVFTQFK